MIPVDSQERPRLKRLLRDAVGRGREEKGYILVTFEKNRNVFRFQLPQVLQFTDGF